MIDNLIFTIGLINIALLIIAIIVIVYNNKMTTTGRVLRVIEILVFPILGPIIICIGILVMSTGTVFNFFIKLNENMIDFLKGLGIALVLAGFFFSARNKHKNFKQS
jgi:hypothetical protein